MRDGWRLNGRGQRAIALRHGESRQDVGVASVAGGWELSLGERRVFARGVLETNGQLHAQLGERRLHAAVVIAAERRHVFLEGRAWPLARVDNLYTGGEGDEAGGGLRAPMPGKIVALLAQAGATVEKGAPLLVMEAMKMEHTITAPANGTLKAFCFAPGDQVADGVELVEFEVTA
jgi:3-methylcrotonyl-CoA carboxylase alpha subunit